MKKLTAPREQHGFEERRSLSADEVELNSYLEEERRDNIKKTLAIYRHKKDKELWHGSNILKAKNILNSKNKFI